MRNKLLIILLLIAMIFMLCGCGNSADVFPTKVASDTKAYIKVQGRTIVVDVESYLFTSNGVVSVTGTDGKNYKTSPVNVVIIKENESR